jgi:hypothetical protein
MLALPVAALEDSASAEVAAETAATREIAPAAGPPASTEEVPVRTLGLIHLGSLPVEPLASGNGAVSFPRRPTTAVEEAPPASQEADPTRPVAPSPAVLSSLPEERQLVRTPGWLRPVVWINRVFDHCAGLFGAPGRFLRRPWGRTFLGLLGLVLLLAAIGWLVLDWMGWPGWLDALR